MCIIDVLVVNVAMPSIAASLHASGASLQLVVAAIGSVYLSRAGSGPGRPAASAAAMSGTACWLAALSAAGLLAAAVMVRAAQRHVH